MNNPFTSFLLPWKLLGLFFLFTEIARAGEFPTYEYHSNIDGKKFFTVVNYDFVHNTPSWKPGDPLPIAEDDILKTARTELDRHLTYPTNWYYKAYDLLHYEDGGKEKWYFFVRFEDIATDRQAAVPVNFSGKVASLLESSEKRSAPRFPSLEEKLLEKAQKIVIPHLELKNATFTEALEVIRREAKEHDPEHLGIPIEIDLKPETTETKIDMPDVPGLSSGTPSPPSSTPENARINIELAQIPLPGAIDYLCQASDCRLILTPKCLAIHVGPPANYPPVVTRTIPLNAAPESEIAKIRANPKEYFVNRGVVIFDRDSYSMADDKTLVVTTSQEQLNSLRTALERLPIRQSNRHSN